MISVNADFAARIADTGTRPIVLVEINSDTDWFFSTRTLNADQQGAYADYDDIIVDVSPLDIRMAQDPFGLAIVADVIVTISNTNPIKSNSIAADFTYIENKPVVIKMGFEQKTTGFPFFLSNFETVFTGAVQDYTWNEGTLKIRVTDTTFVESRLLPQHTISAIGSVPEDNRSLPYPMTFGTMARAKGYVDDSRPLVQSFLFDNTARVCNAVNDLYIWYNGNFRKLRGKTETLDTFDEWSATANNNGADWNTDDESRAGKKKYVLTLIIHPAKWDNNDAVPGDASNGTNGIDGDFTTEATVIAGNANEGHYLVYQLPSFDGFDGDIIEIHFLAKLDTAGISGAGGSQITWIMLTDIADITEALTGPEVFDMQADTTFDNMDTMTDTELDVISLNPTHGADSAVDGISTWNEIRSMWSIIAKFIETAATVRIMDLQEHKVRIDYSLDMLDRNVIYADCAGREFGANWFTGTGNHPTANLCEKPADIIAAIYRHELGLADANFDEGAWADLNTLLGSWVWGGQVLKRQQSRDIINQLCQFAMARQFKRFDGKETIFGYDPARTSDHDFDSTEIIGQSDFGRTPRNQIFNQFIVNYNFNRQTKKYDSNSFINESGDNVTAGGAFQTLCTNSQANYGITAMMEVDCPWIEDLTTAELYIKALVNYHTNRYFTAQMRVLINDGFALELLDIITIDHDWLPAAVKGSTKKWEILGIQKSLIGQFVEITAQSFDAS